MGVFSTDDTASPDTIDEVDALFRKIPAEILAASASEEGCPWSCRMQYERVPDHQRQGTRASSCQQPQFKHLCFDQELATTVSKVGSRERRGFRYCDYSQGTKYCSTSMQSYLRRMVRSTNQSHLKA